MATSLAKVSDREVRELKCGDCVGDEKGGWRARAMCLAKKKLAVPFFDAEAFFKGKRD